MPLRSCAHGYSAVTESATAAIAESVKFRLEFFGVGRARCLVSTHKFLQLADRIHLAKTVELSEATLAVDVEAKKLCAGLSEEQLSWCPRPGRWSIAQNLAHLRATTEVFLPAVDSALETSRIMGLHGEGPFVLSFFGRVMVWRMDARPIIKMQAPETIRPRLLSSPALELEHFLISQAAIRQRIADAMVWTSPLCDFRLLWPATSV